MTRSTVVDFWDESLNSDNGGWNSFGVHEVVEVRYEDEVYRPAQVELVIQNKSAGGGIAYSGVSHTGNASTGVVVTNNSHGLDTGQRVTVTTEDTGAIEYKIYTVETIDINTFYLRHYAFDPKTGLKHMGAETGRVNGDGTPGTLTYVPTGKYSIETTDVNEPDITMGQAIVLWHFPEGFNKTSTYTHDGNTTAITVNYTSHPFADDDIIQVVDDDTGAISDDSYMVATSTVNTFKLKKIKSRVSVAGNGNAGNLAFYFNTKVEGYPLFYGLISEMQESWSAAYGKTLTLTATDHLQFMKNTTAKALNNSVVDTAGAGETIGDDPRQADSLTRLTYLSGVGSQTRFSEAIAQMVADFGEGDNAIYTDNTVNGTTSFTVDAEKHEASGFFLTADELDSGNFEKDISETNYPVLRVMQQLAMQDRHSRGLSATGAFYGSGSNVTITSTAHGLNLNDLIFINNDINDTHIPDGVYRVGSPVTSNSFILLTIDSEDYAQSFGTGTIDWQSAEDGNYGYDFFIDSGMYGVPASSGYKIAGSATEYALRPHLNYFQRGYRQYRPDATSLNITLPLENNTVEDGQTRIMYPDAQFRAGDDEIVTEIDLHSNVASSGIFDFKGSLGHTLEAMRIKQISCKDNVGQDSTTQGKAVFAGKWLGDFHWGRHDANVKRTAGSPSDEESGVLPNRNDYWMFKNSGGSALGIDDINFWYKSDTTTVGSTEDKDRLVRVIQPGMGGIAPLDAAGGVSTHSGYAGLSELSQRGRSFSKGPGSAAESIEGDTTFSQYTTGVVDCDLIKSIQHVQQEGLLSVTAITVSHANSGNSTYLNIQDTAHGLQTGAWIKVITGDILDGDEYWKNYYRVEYIDDDNFFITRPPIEAYEGISGDIPTASDIYAASSRVSYGGTTDVQTYKIAYNVFNGVGRVMYQTLNGRTELSFTENFVLFSDRIKKDYPYAGVEVYAVDSQTSSTSAASGLPCGAAVMPDSTLYGDELEVGTNSVAVRFRKGDKLSETRFLMHDNNGASTRHIFKNTQAIITQSLTGDKSRAKSEELSYSMEGSDLNEVRRTAAAMLSRSSRDLLRGQLRIVEYPFIKLSGQAASGTTSASLTHVLTTSVGVYGGRPGMLVHKTDEDGNFTAGVLAEDITTTKVNGTLWNSNTWSQNDYYRMYVHLRAGHSVRVTDPRSSVQSNMIVTKLQYSEGPGISGTTMEVIGFKDSATGFAIKPLGKVNASIKNSDRSRPTNTFKKGKGRFTGAFAAGT